MDEWTEIRRKVLVEGASKRSILRDYGIGPRPWPRSWPTPSLPAIRWPKSGGSPCSGPIWDHRPDPGRRQRGPAQAAPHGQADLRAPARRARLHGLLLPGADGGEVAKQYSKEAFVPLCHPPGHAQFDFGEAVVEIAGVRARPHWG